MAGQLLLHIFRDLCGRICPVCDTFMVFPDDGEVICPQCDPPWEDLR